MKVAAQCLGATTAHRLPHVSAASLSVDFYFLVELTTDCACCATPRSSRATPALDIVQYEEVVIQESTDVWSTAIVQINNYYKTWSSFYERFFLVLSLFECFCSYFIPSPFVLFQILVTIIITLES